MRGLLLIVLFWCLVVSLAAARLDWSLIVMFLMWGLWRAGRYAR